MWVKYANSGSRSRQGRQPYKIIRVAHAPPDLEPFNWLRQHQYAAQHHHCSPGPAASARANKPPSRFSHGFVTVLSITSRASCKVISSNHRVRFCQLPSCGVTFPALGVGSYHVSLQGCKTFKKGPVRGCVHLYYKSPPPSILPCWVLC